MRAKLGRIRYLCFLLTLAAVSPGCSLIFVTPPKSNPTQARGQQATETRTLAETHDECTSGKLAPVVDALIAGYQVYRTGVALDAKDRQYANAPFNRNTDIALGITFFTTFLVSSVYGWDATSRCAERRQLESDRASQQRREREDRGGSGSAEPHRPLPRVEPATHHHTVGAVSPVPPKNDAPSDTNTNEFPEKPEEATPW
jgi:hypothetical protein